MLKLVLFLIIDYVESSFTLRPLIMLKLVLLYSLGKCEN